MLRAQLRTIAQSLTGRGLLAGALGGLVLTSLFLQAHGASLNRYALNRGKPVVGYLIVWVLALAIGALFGRFAGVRAARDLGYALGRGLLIGLGWFIAASCLVLPVLRGVHPFSLDPAVGGEVVLYLVYGMLLGVGYYQIGELLQRRDQPLTRGEQLPRAEALARSGANGGTTNGRITQPVTTPVRVRRTSSVTQPQRRTTQSPHRQARG